MRTFNYGSRTIGPWTTVSKYIPNPNPYQQ